MKRQAKAENETTQLCNHSVNGDTVDCVTLDLLAKWRLQDATENPDEIGAAEQELAAFKKAMNENRTLAGQPLVFP
jgi:hypothetical protein